MNYDLSDRVSVEHLHPISVPVVKAFWGQIKVCLLIKNAFAVNCSLQHHGTYSIEFVNVKGWSSFDDFRKRIVTIF